MKHGVPIKVFNGGDMRRDFTFVDDIVTGVVACLDAPPADDGGRKAGGSASPHRVYNIGNQRSEELTRMIGLVETAVATGTKTARSFILRFASTVAVGRPPTGLDARSLHRS